MSSSTAKASPPTSHTYNLYAIATSHESTVTKRIPYAVSGIRDSLILFSLRSAIGNTYSDYHFTITLNVLSGVLTRYIPGITFLPSVIIPCIVKIIEPSGTIIFLPET